MVSKVENLARLDWMLTIELKRLSEALCWVEFNWWFVGKWVVMRKPKIEYMLFVSWEFL